MMIQEFWHYNLVNISGNDVKFSNIIIAIILLICGLTLAKKVAKFAGRSLQSTFKKDKAVTNLAQKAILYLSYIIVILFSLQLANIPLSIFAFIGGAFAIGLGFGIQGFMNNLVCSIILILEAPIKIGDVIKINDNIGKVKLIDSYSVMLETLDGKEIIIPSSAIIQKEISKWSASQATQYNVYIDIYKNEKSINHQEIIKQISLATKNLTFISKSPEIEIFLINIGQSQSQFCFCFHYDTNIAIKMWEIKNEINFALLNTLTESFSITYPTNFG